MNSRSERQSLAPFFRPHSIAVVGASRSPGRVGHRMVQYLQATGFAGPIFPINPGSGSVAGLPSFAAIDSTPAVADLAIISLPARAAAHSVALAAKAGVGTALVLADVGIEGDEEGRHTLGRELAEIASTTGIRVIGPNTIGYRVVEDGGHTVWATFNAPPPEGVRPPLPVAIISQGGGLATYLGNTMGESWGRDVSYLIDTGNEADVQAADCLDYLAGLESGAPRAVGLVLESPSRARRLVDSVRAALGRNVSVVALILGRTEPGRASALLHTAAIAGRAEVLKEEITAAGATVVDSAQDFVDALAVHGLGCAPSGRGVGILSWSGGFGIHVADICIEAGLAVPELQGGDDVELVRQLGIAVARNPLDLSAVADRQGAEPAPVRLRLALDLMLRQNAVSSIVLWAAGMMRADVGQQLLPVLLEYRARSRKPLFLCGAYDGDIRRTLTEAGILIFDMPGRIAAALANSTRRSSDGGVAESTVEPVAASSSMSLSGSAALRRLADESGVSTASEAVVARADEARHLLAAYPDGFVLKVDDSAIVHKSELGLVELVRPGADIASVYDRLTAARQGASSSERIVAQEYVSGREIAIGGYSDASMGKSLLVAAGGLYVEFLHDQQFAAAPVSATRARAMVESLRIHQLLAGARGQVPSDVDALIDAIVRVGRWFAESDDVSAFDLNPLIVRPAGLGVKAVDATIEFTERPERP